ncbi:type II toxin-antitoxin system RelE/ParE family toxin [Gramella sp. BOM4]|nr:type II toxin-antitoxin system RelE/ParE family toxin [Christiangramia bathymodioli]
MKLEVIWSKFAERQLDEIFEYYYENASPGIARKLIQDLLKEPNRLKKDLKIGQIEEFLKDRKITYRYLLFKNYKIIYSIDTKNGFIKIADVFDTRQHPLKIKRFE